MRLDELLRSCFQEHQCKIFLHDTLPEQWLDVWDSTQGVWATRAFELVVHLKQVGLVNRSFFEALVKARPGRADDIAAVCRDVLQEPLNYAVGDPPPAARFPWVDYESAMSRGLLQLLRFAAYDARSRGYTTISTSEIVRVYGALQPWVRAVVPVQAKDLSSLFGQEDPFDGVLGASYCVSKTMHGLAQTTHQPGRFTEHDVFLDLLRFGSGTSVRRLVADGSALDTINLWSRRLGIGRVTRHAILDEVDETPGAP